MSQITNTTLSTLLNNYQDGITQSNKAYHNSSSNYNILLSNLFSFHLVSNQFHIITDKSTKTK